MEQFVDFDEFVFPTEEPAEPVIEKDPIEEEPNEDSDDIIEEEPGEPEDLSDLTAYYETAKKLNIINTPDDFEFDGSEEKLQEALNITKSNLQQEAYQHLWDSISDEFKPALQYALKGGKLEDFVKTYNTNLDDIELDTKAAQRDIIFRHWKETSNYSDEKINRLIARAEEIGDLEEEAQDSLAELKKLYEQRKQDGLKNLEEQEAERLKLVETQTQMLSDEITALEVDSARKNKLKAFLFNPIKVDNESTTHYAYTIKRILSDPKHLVQLADILTDYDPQKGINLERFEKRIKTKNTQSVQNLIREQLDKKPVVKGTNKSAKEDFDWESFLNL